MTQIFVVRIIVRKNIYVFVSGNIHSHAESFFSCWQSLMHVHLSLQVSRTCSTNKPTQHVHLSLGVSRTCLFLKWHVHPGRVELHMSFFNDRLYQRVKHSERHDLTFMDSFAMITFDIVTSRIDMFI